MAAKMRHLSTFNYLPTPIHHSSVIGAAIDMPNATV